VRLRCGRVRISRTSPRSTLSIGRFHISEGERIVRSLPDDDLAGMAFNRYEPTQGNVPGGEIERRTVALPLPSTVSEEVAEKEIIQIGFHFLRAHALNIRGHAYLAD